MEKMIVVFSILFFGNISVCQSLELDLDNAKKISRVPVACIWQEYPNKLGQVLADSSHLQSPNELHPIFYGCFDWHSSVHGHWMLAHLMNKFPDTDLEKEIVSIFDQQFQIPNVQKELLYFLPKVNKSFERTYGWAWYLKLIEELQKSKYNETHQWTNNLQSLTTRIADSYKEFLPKLVYPIRVGEHTNTAFGLSLALDYARTVKDEAFEKTIIERARHYYIGDEGCPIGWEPSGFDFISPCLQEAELMAKILEEKEFKKWMEEFMPLLFEKKNPFDLEPGQVSDRTDGKLVHLDGLNFSRAWCLYGLAKVLPKKKEVLLALGDKHMNASKDQIIGADYMGSHWLASFYIKALEAREKLNEEED